VSFRKKFIHMPVLIQPNEVYDKNTI